MPISEAGDELERTSGEISGMVLRLEKCSIHDGDGLRTVVFLKGCPLRCAWCASPESQDSKLEFGYGKVKSAAELVAEIIKDEIFYYHSGGGLTLSGGEPLLQGEFCEAVLKQCKKMGINTAIETCAYGDYETLAKLLPFLDTVYADIKLVDDKEHIKWTGASNETILSNIRRMAQDFSGNLRIRIPLIPTLNMGDSSIQAAAVFCQSLEKLDLVEFLPYHRLGLETYRKLNREYPLENIMPPGPETMANIRTVFAQAAPDVKLIF